MTGTRNQHLERAVREFVRQFTFADLDDRSRSLWNELDRIEPTAPVTRITELTRPDE